MSQTATAPGRVYRVTSDPPANGRTYTFDGSPIPFVYRIEFDADADEGMATVFAYLSDSDNGPVVNPFTREAVKVEFRTWVRYVPRERAGSPIPPVYEKFVDGRWVPGDGFGVSGDVFRRPGDELAIRMLEPDGPDINGIRWARWGLTPMPTAGE